MSVSSVAPLHRGGAAADLPPVSHTRRIRHSARSARAFCCPCLPCRVAGMQASVQDSLAFRTKARGQTNLLACRRASVQDSHHAHRCRQSEGRCGKNHAGSSPGRVVARTGEQRRVHRRRRPVILVAVDSIGRAGDNTRQRDRRRRHHRAGPDSAAEPRPGCGRWSGKSRGQHASSAPRGGLRSCAVRSDRTGA